MLSQILVLLSALSARSLAIPFPSASFGAAFSSMESPPAVASSAVSTTSSATESSFTGVSVGAVNAVVSPSGVDVCSLDQSDPASWEPSAATSFMQNWFDANGTANWLNAMDDTTQIDGFDSVLDCKPLGGNTCAAPITPCKDFTPPVLRLVRIAATNAHDFFTLAHEQLQDTTISDILSIDQVIADFAPDPPEAGFNFVNAVAAGFFLAGPIAGIAGKEGLSSILNIVGGALGFANAVNPPAEPIDSTDEWQRVLSDQLGATFTSAADAIEGINSKLFGGDADYDLDGLVSSLRSAGLVDTTEGLNSISTIFASGAFLADQDESSLTAGLDAGFARVKQSLVAGLMRAQNWYVFINTQLSEGECGVLGSRFINNECMILSKRSSSDGRDTDPIHSDILSRLDGGEGYNINVAEMYQNAVDCNGGRLDTSVSFGAGLPKCFWSLPILRVDGEFVCDLIPEGLASAQGYAAGVQLTESAC
ncbi:uncharacterized protein LTR77_010920 [Saxophila tyrrhenica]|uniref:Uncharacterized protein n=1 Tax=Saxophila tyrrhenica TaxID=1690608 RepID=A0AAV9NUA4_9PEZI|nr:hypothetical protein LTR77_010920 [Saxophila tyrrhenica]